MFLGFRNVKRKQFIEKAAVWEHTLLGMLMIKMTIGGGGGGGGVD